MITYRPRQSTGSTGTLPVCGARLCTKRSARFSYSRDDWHIFESQVSHAGGKMIWLIYLSVESSRALYTALECRRSRHSGTRKCIRLPYHLTMVNFRQGWTPMTSKNSQFWRRSARTWWQLWCPTHVAFGINTDPFPALSKPRISSSILFKVTQELLPTHQNVFEGLLHYRHSEYVRPEQP